MTDTTNHTTKLTPAQLSTFDPAFWQRLAEDCERYATDARLTDSERRFWRDQAAFCLKSEVYCAEHFRRFKW